jgi:hypothetical protein
MAPPAGRSPRKRHDVPYAGFPITLQQLRDVLAAMADAGEVGGRAKVGLGRDPAHRLEGCVAGRTPAP